VSGEWCKLQVAGYWLQGCKLQVDDSKYLLLMKLPLRLPAIGGGRTLVRLIVLDLFDCLKEIVTGQSGFIIFLNDQ
jgi:hypothetical protein